MQKRIRWAIDDVPVIVEALVKVSTTPHLMIGNLIAANNLLPPELKRPETSLRSSFYHEPRNNVLLEIESALDFRQREVRNEAKAQVVERAQIAADPTLAAKKEFQVAIGAALEQLNTATTSIVSKLFDRIDDLAQLNKSLADRTATLETQYASMRAEFLAYLESATEPAAPEVTDPPKVSRAPLDTRKHILILGPRGVQDDKIREGFEDRAMFVISDDAQYIYRMNQRKVSSLWHVIQMTNFSAHVGRKPRERFASWTYVTGGVSAIRDAITKLLQS